MDIRTIVFDMDGTLIDAPKGLQLSTNRALESAGLPPISIEQTKQYMGSGFRTLVLRAVYGYDFVQTWEDVNLVAPREIVVRDGTRYVIHEDREYLLPLTAKEFEPVLDAFLEDYRLHSPEHTDVYPGIREMIADLKSLGCRLAVVSNKDDDAVRQQSEAYLPGLDLAVGLTGSRRKKPNPDTVEEAIRALDGIPETTIFVGDTEIDLETAKNAGIPCVSCLWGCRARTELENAGAETLIETPAELVELVRNSRLSL